MEHSRITQVFLRLQSEGKTALMPYFMAGYPTVEGSRKAILAASNAGADLIELGIPYSDPLADGPVIQEAGRIALAGGMTTDAVFQLVRSIREESAIPIVLMTYYNLLFRYGLERFASKVADSGADGVIVPDLPPEEAGPWREAAGLAGLDAIFLVAPTSTPERIALAASASTGFVYCVSLTGVTGERTALPANLVDLVKRVKAVTDKPVAVGFGISTPEQAGEVGRIADGVIIGSALVRLIGEAGENAPALVREFIVSVKEVYLA
ncbi:MAG: tryptophan synthase subunit alpha [Actinobacteria bacterium]|nr:tryptophan synthase subunit alpha [Actinomycetota bacterium]